MQNAKYKVQTIPRKKSPKNVTITVTTSIHLQHDTVITSGQRLWSWGGDTNQCRCVKFEMACRLKYQDFIKHKHPISFYCDDISLKSPDTWIEYQNPSDSVNSERVMNSRGVTFWLWLTFPALEFVNKIRWLSPNI